MIEEIASEIGPSKLKINSLIILGITLIILVMFAFFGSVNKLTVTGSVTGMSDSNEVILEDIKEDIIEEPIISKLSDEGKYKLILSVLKLKDLDKTVTRLQFAEKVSNIDEYIKALNHPKVTEQWESMVTCLEKGCNDLYYDLLNKILSYAFIQEEDKSFLSTIFSDEPEYGFMPELLQNVVALENAVDTNDVIETSKAMIATNSLISKVDSTEIGDLWNELVNCDLKCSLYDQILVKLTELKLNSYDN